MTTPDSNDLVARWIRLWSTSDAQAWVALYAPNATYIDHAFRITRTGHELLTRHHQIWRTANPDFVMTLNPAHPVWWNGDEAKQNGQYSIRTLNTGTFENDLPRRKASGRTWTFSAVVDLTIENGLIVKVNEWYSQDFDLSVTVDEYH